MEEQLCAQVDALFASVHRSKRSEALRRQILRDALLRYHEERAKGKSSQAAFGIARAAARRPLLPRVVLILELVFWMAALVGCCVLAALRLWPYMLLPLPAAAVLLAVLHGILRVYRRPSNWLALIRALLWALLYAAYLRLSLNTGAWALTWLLLPIGACFTLVLGSIYRLARHESGRAKQITSLAFGSILALLFTALLAALLLLNATGLL